MYGGVIVLSYVEFFFFLLETKVSYLSFDNCSEFVSLAKLSFLE